MVLQEAVHRLVAGLPVTLRAVAVIRPVVEVLLEVLPVAILPVAILPAAVTHPVAVVRPVVIRLAAVVLPALAILHRARPAVVILRKVVLPVVATRKAGLRAIRRPVAGRATRPALIRARLFPPKSRTRCCSLASVAAVSSCCR